MFGRSKVRRAKRLASAGRLDDAIATLDRQRPDQRDFESERLLRQLRHRAGLRQAGAGFSVWPPVVADRFPVTPGIVEIGVDDLTVSSLRSAVFCHGAAIVRGLFDPPSTELLRHAVDQAFEARDRFESAGPDSVGDVWYDPFEPDPECDVEIPREWMREGGGVLAADSPRGLSTLFEHYRAVGVFDLVAGYLGEPPAMSVLKTTLRIVPPSTNAESGWHQDGAFLGEQIRSLNLWVALSHCGRDAASLDIVPGRLDHIVRPGSGGAAFDWSVGNDDVRRLCPDGSWIRPEFAPGDVIFFDHMNLHRTGVDPSMTQSRYAIESWFFARSAYPQAQIPIAVG